jgi:serine/threonine protein kinase
MSGNSRTFGPYALVRRIGAGGMAETFEGLRTGPGGFEQRVCVKRILPEVSDDPNFVQLFREEARVAARLRHANIAQLLDVGVIDGAHYLTLELVEGCDLRRLLQFERARQGFAPGVAGGGLTSGVVAFLAAELATALEVAHGGTTAIVHRDISPSNVLLSTAGEVKLADFGIARAITDNLATRTQAVRGKVPYMAPEYALRGVVDRRVDLFALGVLLYEALAGVRPFDGKTDVETLSHLEQGLHTPLAERCPGAPGALVAAIEQLILPTPDARTPSATALLDALVDVAPPPTARRILGELVAQCARGLAPAPITLDAIDPLAATSHAATPTSGAFEASAPLTTAPDATRPSYATKTVAPRDAAPVSQTRALPPASPPAPHTALLTGAAPLPSQPPPRPYAIAASDAPTRTALFAVHESVTATLTRADDDARDALPTTLDAVHHVPDDAASLRSPAAAAPRHEASAPLPSRSAAASTARESARKPSSVVRFLLGAFALGSGTLAALALRSRPQAEVAVPDSASPPPVSDTSAAGASVPAAPDDTSPGRAHVTAPPPRAAPVPPPRTDDATAPTAPSPRDRTTAARANARSSRPAPAGPPVERPTRDDATDTAARALLTIVSDPGHPLFVDGRRAGEGPLTVPLAPGRHVLTAGQGAEAPTLTIELAPGERRRVVLR